MIRHLPSSLWSGIPAENRKYVVRLHGLAPGFRPGGSNPGRRGVIPSRGTEGTSVNGKPADSKPATEGSNPSGPALPAKLNWQSRRLLISWLWVRIPRRVPCFIRLAVDQGFGKALAQVRFLDEAPFVPAVSQDVGTNIRLVVWDGTSFVRM